MNKFLLLALALITILTTSCGSDSTAPATPAAPSVLPTPEMK